MELLQPTFRRSLSIWWSFAWRGFVLWLPVVFVMFVLMFTLIPFPKPGQRPDPDEMGKVFALFPFIWALMLGGMVVTQTLAMQWMLRAQRWKDFFVALIPASDPREFLVQK